MHLKKRKEKKKTDTEQTTPRQSIDFQCGHTVYKVLRSHKKEVNHRVKQKNNGSIRSHGVDLSYVAALVSLP